MKKLLLRGVSICAIAALAACAQTPLAPTTAVTPGPGKSDQAFADDMAACKTAAAQAVAGQAEAANSTALGGAVANALGGSTTGSAAGSGIAASQTAQAAIQQQYDTAYNQCMYARGNNVPGMAPSEQQAAPAAAPAPVYQRSPLVAQVQAELIRLGYLHGSADGVAGPRTAAAIRQFETDKNLTVDGQPSRNLLANLKASDAGAAPAPAAPPAAAPDSSGKFALPPPPT